MRSRLLGWMMFALFLPSDLSHFTDLSLDYSRLP